MRTVTIITNDECTHYATPGHPERPQRVRATQELLRTQTEVPLIWIAPGTCTEAALLRAHSPEHLARLEVARDFDVDTAYHQGIGTHAHNAVGAAISALSLAREGALPFSLMRPPGHHATPDAAMGFCYLGSMGIAVLEALAGGIERVGVFDFDVHHGNGTEAILVDKPGASFVSVHQSPCYPGTGLQDVGSNCFNYPVQPGLPRMEYREVLTRALERMMQSDPQLIGVSAGFDAYDGDPLAQETLLAEDYQWIGRQLRETGVPTFSILEGGYSDDLPVLVLAYLRGLAGE